MPPSHSSAGVLRLVHQLTSRAAEDLQNPKTVQAKSDRSIILRGLGHLAHMVARGQDIFGYEPWHPLHFDLPLAAPAEMLLRLQTVDGKPFAPYPFIMALYRNGMTAHIDTILFLCGLEQFSKSAFNQVSINISARSLRDEIFVQTVLSHYRAMTETTSKAVIIEIHESTPHMTMSRDVLEDFMCAGFTFALDDVGLSMHDVMRLAEFEGITDYIKLDRQSVCAQSSNPVSLDHVMSFARAMLPDALVVAEGVKSADHAFEIYKRHPDIHFVQGRDLPNEDTFSEYFKRRILGSKRPLTLTDYPPEFSG